VNRYIRSVGFSVFLNLICHLTLAQNTIPFGDFPIDELRNKVYASDPGADAIILSDKAIASVNFDGKDFFVELVRNTRIRIVNRRAFDLANVTLSFYTDDIVSKYRASTFNLQDGKKIETPVPKKSFIREKTSNYRYSLKFSFPNVNEGSIIEYSYTVRLSENALYTLYPWRFQSGIPVVESIFTVVYPEYFNYKSVISGSATSVKRTHRESDGMFFGNRMNIYIETWSANNLPAFRDEPYITSRQINLTGVRFELASVNFPSSSRQDISATYEKLTEKLLDRTDFGRAIANAGFLAKYAENVTHGCKNDLEKLKKIHEYVSTKILWNGLEDFTASASLAKVFREERGNSADINFILIAMLRSQKIKADPVILSTRSNGPINQLQAMEQQFNYVVAYVMADGNFYLVDATDPLRPFNLLPSECVNGYGRQISKYESNFVELKNDEKYSVSRNLNLVLDRNGELSGTLKTTYSGLSAYDFRSQIRFAGEYAYHAATKFNAADLSISEINLGNLHLRDSAVVEILKFKVKDRAQHAGNKMIVNPFLTFFIERNPFYQEERFYPVDFRHPKEVFLTITLTLPEGVEVLEIPQNASYILGKNDGSYRYTCSWNGKEITVTTMMKITRTTYPTEEYRMIQDFFSKIMKKQSDLIVLKSL